jgi:hypothetical protein
LGDFERLVPEPILDFHQIEAGAEPVRRRRLPKSVQVVFLAYGPDLARRFNFMAVIVSAFPNRRFALPAIQPRTLCDCFELAKEVTFRFLIFVREHPPV